jgi:hypothetical protein
MSNDTGERRELSEQEKQELVRALLSGSEYVYLLFLLIFVATAHYSLILRKLDGFALR